MSGEQDSIAELVRRADPDRYLSSLFAPEAKRRHLLALYAFNIEIARVADAVRQPMLGEIRLAWWRETLEGARGGKPRNHPVAHAMAEVFAAIALPEAPLEAMLEARTFDASTDTFPDRAALERYCDATSGNVMRLAGSVLGVPDDALAREAGTAYAMAGILRALPHHSERRKCFLPDSLLREAGLTQEVVFAGRDREKLRAVVAEIASWAREHLTAARRHRLPKQEAPAYLPAAVVPLTLRRVTRSWFDPFAHPAEVPIHRRQLRLLSAAMRCRL